MPSGTKAGWLVAIFLLSTLQGWLLSVASELVGAVFFLHMARAIALVIFSKPLVRSQGFLSAWSGAIAWTITGTINDVWHDAVSEKALLAVVMAMVLAAAIAWAWTVALGILGRKLLSSYSPRQTCWILLLNSYGGFGLGILLLPH